MCYAFDISLLKTCTLILLWESLNDDVDEGVPGAYHRRYIVELILRGRPDFCGFKKRNPIDIVWEILPFKFIDNFPDDKSLPYALSTVPSCSCGKPKTRINTVSWDCSSTEAPAHGR